MIPSLVAGEIRSALVDYLATTFSLCDDDVSNSLADFLTDRREGIFRGPYLHVRTPFRSVDPTWTSPLGWLPDGFVPYLHQAAAFERLSSAGSHTPQPTIVTTGTGSGKTECFLMPILDHCARARAAGIGKGVKSLILYPMNALASDQAGRIASLIHQHAHLSSLTAGLYIGENGSHKGMGADHLIDDRHTLRSEPPDILLTNYKMLDFLLLRREDQSLWADNTPDTLHYVVLDEFHTYDGAQGTDVAMLLRRLGAMLGMATEENPLGSAAPVATSATLGSEPSALDDLRSFAHKVFGSTFDEQSVINESRQSIEEACGPLDNMLPIPTVEQVNAIPADDIDVLAAAFCNGADETVTTVADRVALGDRLLAHPLTRAVLYAASDRPRTIDQVITLVAGRIPSWASTTGSGSGTDGSGRVATDTGIALSRYLSLMSIARRRLGTREAPLFSVEVQLWIREISRLLRSVEPTPQFRWLDSPPAATLSPDQATDGHDDAEAVSPKPDLELPSVYCRKCGHSGWMASTSHVSDTLLVNPGAIYRSAFDRSPSLRVMLRANPVDPRAVHLDPATRTLSPTPTGASDSAASNSTVTVPVYVTPDDDAAKAQRCPACDERDSIRFIGLAVASLASVSINTMFGSPNVDSAERKLLAFTDSVQDASHRASFFAGRTHRFNLRSLMSAALQEAGSSGLSLADLGDILMTSASSPHLRYQLLPPDLQRDPHLRSVWSENPDPTALELLAGRVGFEVDLEFGLRSRVGRTLEQSVAAVARVDLGDPVEVDKLVTEVLADVLGDLPPGSGDVIRRNEMDNAGTYVMGIVERMRTSGAIFNSLLDPYITDNGKQWWIWGGRPRGLPPFTPDQSRPTFATTATQGSFDSVITHDRTPTWYLDWAMRSLGLDAGRAQQVNLTVLRVLAATGNAVVSLRTSQGSEVFGLDRRAVRVHDIATDSNGLPEPSLVRCDLCAGMHTVAPVDFDRWLGAPCRRYRCPGHYSPVESRDPGYYRRFYRQGVTRRVITGEHTGLLGRHDREALEGAFRSGTSPDAPNVLTATPTLEMGIDIGDLSTVMLTSVPHNPASYIQRVGRAGRATGNALVTTFVRSDTHGLYYLAEPEAMLAGSVRPPNCYLEATETLHRQYVAYLLDRVAERQIDVASQPNRIADIMKAPFEAEGLFRALIDASIHVDGSGSSHVEAFLDLFDDQIGPAARDSVRLFATGGLEARLKDAVDTWMNRRDELRRRRDRLRDAIERLEKRGINGPEDQAEHRSLRGERSAVIALLREHRGSYWISGLESLGVLPNYTLVDDSTTLRATLWSRDDEDNYQTQVLEYARDGRLAIAEFAPGNTFYAGGHRHYIDALETNSATEPTYESWRLCPDCSHATMDLKGGPITVCPRCGGTGIGNIGSSHKVLRMHTALSSGSEESTRVYDETDERTRARYELVTLVDPDPAEISGAWLLGDRAFGAELCTRTELRTFNLGFAERTASGQKVEIAGKETNITGFTTCGYCGAVRDARNDVGGRRPERLHQGWCKVRSSYESEQWDRLILLHELTTEAIRFLVPVSMFEVEERLASFKGALLLGIRAELGGNPDHLSVALTDSPNRTGQGRRRFLVLYDRLPGGTGYLAPLADPERIRRILVAARRAITTCRCRDEGRQACHRCLLGVVDRWEYDLVSRSLAKEILDSLLGDWVDPTPVDTIATASVAKVEESELERRFKIAIREWAEREREAEVTFTKVPGHGKYEAFELSILFGGDRVRYRIAEQEGITTTPSTQPDFVITRMDTSGPKIAVYLDGFEFHASSRHNNIAEDALKRDGVRASGMLVWNLTWTDVEEFHRAMTADPPRNVPDRTLLTPAAIGNARDASSGYFGGFHVDALEQNPLALLLDFLVRPDVSEWRQTVLSAIVGAASQGPAEPLDADGLREALGTALAGQPITAPTPTGPEVARGASYMSPGGLTLSLFLDTTVSDPTRWTAFAVLPDDSSSVASADHQARWADWTAWANLLQFLGLPHDPIAGVVAGASNGPEPEDLWLWHATGSAAAPDATGKDATSDTKGVELTLEQLEDLDLIDPSVVSLVSTMLRSGHQGMVPGYEINGHPLEAAWPAAKVAVLIDGQVGSDGWNARNVADWTVDELDAALRSSTDDTAEKDTPG